MKQPCYYFFMFVRNYIYFLKVLKAEMGGTYCLHIQTKILDETLYGKKPCEGFSNIWMDGLILKCVFETEVTIVMGVKWHRIGSSNELKMLYGNRGLRNRQFMSPPPK